MQGCGCPIYFFFVDGASCRFCTRGVRAAAPSRASHPVFQLGQYHNLSGRQSGTHSRMGLRIYLAVFKVGGYFQSFS